MVRGPSLGSKRLISKPASAEAILAHVLKKLGWTARYNKGQLDGNERLQLLEAIRAFSRAWIKHEAQRFAERELGWEENQRSLLGPAEIEQVGRSLREQAGRFFKRIKGFVRESIVAGAMGLLGPRALTSDELQQAERQAVTQDAYLDRFQADMLRPMPFNPDKTMEVFVLPAPITANQFIARAESYGSCVWGYSQEIARATYARTMVFDQERLVLGDAEHCSDCLEDSARGFVPIGSLRSIGDRQCRQNCHCRFLFRKGSDGEIHVVG